MLRLQSRVGADYSKRMTKNRTDALDRSSNVLQHYQIGSTQLERLIAPAQAPWSD